MKAIHISLLSFIGNVQCCALREGLAGEEHNFFVEKIQEYQDRVQTMPKTYEQDGKGDQSTVYLHYFLGGADWYITERDMEDAQLQAFGLADWGYGPEWGYISIVEILANHGELDLFWTPKTVKQMQEER